MANRRRPKAPVEGGTENFPFQSPRGAGQNGAQRPPGTEADDSFAGADDHQMGKVRSDKFTTGEPLSDEEIGALIQQELTDARSFIDYEVGPMRAYLTGAYRGTVDVYSGDDSDDSDDQDGDFGEGGIVPSGQSSIRSRDVRDTILGILPDLMRIYTSTTDSVVEYQAQTAESMEQAKQATDYANYVFMRDNPGFNTLYSIFKDAMIRKTGIVKVWWDNSVIVRWEHYKDLDPVAMFLLDQDSNVESIEVLEEKQPDKNDPDGVPLCDVRVKRRITGGRIRVEALPGEEFLIDRRARSLEYFNVLAHRSMKTVSELVALGYDEDEVREHVTSPELDMNIEYIERQPWARVVGSFDGMNPSTQRALYCEAYAWIDSDGDGIAELHKICTMGPSYKVIEREPVEWHPFADFQCDPEPHTFFGEGIADVTEDIQRVKTQITRDALDSLGQSIRPRLAIVEGQVNYDDVLNNEIGAVIRQRAPGMVQSLDVPFVGQQAFPMIEYFDSVLEKRTGVSLSSMGLDPDALQSTTRLAVQQQMSASQGRTELLARILADGMRKVFKLILNLSVTHQDKPRTIMLRGKWVPIDPRYWNADMEVIVNTALGNGTAEQQIAALTQMAAKQEQIIMTLGPTNPICSMAQYANTLRKIAELSGFKNSDLYFSEVPPDWKPPSTGQQPPPNPQMLAVQQDGQIAQQRLTMEQQKNQWEHERQQQNDAANAALKLHELELKYGVKIKSDTINAEAQAQGDQVHEQAETQRHAMSLHSDALQTGFQTVHDAHQQQLGRQTQEGIAQAQIDAQPEPTPGGDK